MDSPSTHVSLLERLRDRGDDPAWRRFERRYGELIVRFCRSRGLQHADAEDIRQLVLARLMRALPDFRYDRERGRFRAFLGTIVRNEVARHRGRLNTGTTRVDMDEVTAHDSPDDSARWEREWILDHLRTAMQVVRGTFDARSIEVFERLLGGAATDQVADEFSMTTQAVHKVKQRIRERLREIIAEQVRHEDGEHG